MPGSLADPFPAGASSVTRDFSIYCVYEEAVEPPAGPWRIARAQAWSAGSVRGQIHHAGPVAGQVRAGANRIQTIPQ